VLFVECRSGGSAFHTMAKADVTKHMAQRAMLARAQQDRLQDSNIHVGVAPEGVNRRPDRHMLP